MISQILVMLKVEVTILFAVLIVENTIGWNI